MIIPVNGVYPKIHPSVWMAPTAVVIGDVEIGEGSSIWFNTVIRGDVFPIKIGKYTNIQDGSIIHGTYKKAGATIGDRVTIGHGVILHGCQIDDLCLVGMGSIVMDNAHVEKQCIIGAGSLVTEEAQFGPGQLIVGRPAKIKRPLNKEEFKFLETSCQNYQTYTSWYAGTEGRIP